MRPSCHAVSGRHARLFAAKRAYRTTPGLARTPALWCRRQGFFAHFCLSPLTIERLSAALRAWAAHSIVDWLRPIPPAQGKTGAFTLGRTRSNNGEWRQLARELRMRATAGDRLVRHRARIPSRKELFLASGVLLVAAVMTLVFVVAVG